MKVVILAAGYATRLYPLTENMPKCLLSVGGQTILEQICGKIDRLKNVEELIIVTNAKFFDQLNHWKNKSRVNTQIINDGTLSNETRLGAIGDLGLALKQNAIDSDILLLASDNLFDQELTDFIAFAEQKKDAPTIAIYDIRDPQLAAKKFGVIEKEASGKVLNIEEKPEKPRTSFIGMGVYYFPKNTLELIREYLGQKNVQDAPGHYVRWLMGKTQIFSFLFSGIWYDIGDLKALDEANQIFHQKS